MVNHNAQGQKPASASVFCLTELREILHPKATPDSKMGNHNAQGHKPASATVFYLTELREMIMVYLDPSNMLNLVLTSHAPMASFKKNPLKFINLSSDVGYKRSRIHYHAMFILQLTAPACLNTIKTKKHPGQAAMDEQWIGFFQDSSLDSAKRFDKWMIEHFPTAPVPDVLYRQPLKSLKNLARIHEAIEFLIASGLWASLDLSKYGVDVHPEQGSDTICFSKADIIRECLWYFQFDCVAISSQHLVKKGQVSFPDVKLKFESIVDWNGSVFLNPSVKTCFRQICTELLKPLQTVFEHNCAIAFQDSIHKSLPNLPRLDMKNNPHHHLINDQLKDLAYWEKGLAKKSYIIFRGNKGHQMPLGLPFLAWMHRISALSVQTHETRPFIQKWRTWLYGRPSGSDRCRISWRQLEKIKGHAYAISRQNSAGDQEYVYLLTPYSSQNSSILPNLDPRVLLKLDPRVLSNLDPRVLLDLDPRVVGLWVEDRFKSVQLALGKLS